MTVCACVCCPKVESISNTIRAEYLPATPSSSSSWLGGYLDNDSLRAGRQRASIETLELISTRLSLIDIDCQRLRRMFHVPCFSISYSVLPLLFSVFRQFPQKHRQISIHFGIMIGFWFSVFRFRFFPFGFSAPFGSASSDEKRRKSFIEKV